MVALGLTLIYGVLNQINFAHADFVTVGAFTAFFTATRFATKILGLPDTGGYLLSLVAALGAGAVLGFLVNAAVFAPLRSRGDELRPLIATIGVSVLLENGQLALFGPIPYQFDSPLARETIRLGRIFFSARSLLVVAVSVAAIAALYAFMRFTFLGKALRAVAQDRETAGLMGINPNLLIGLTIVIASALAGMAGALLGPVVVLTPFTGASLIVKAFAIVIIGGFGNMQGTIIAGPLVGIVEAVTVQYLRAGQLNLGQSAFFGIGAYVSTLLIKSYGWSFWLAALAAVGAAGLLGLALAAFAVRLRGHYLAIASLGFAVITYQVLVNWEKVTQGVRGIYGIAPPVPNTTALFYLVAAIAVLVYVLLDNLVRSPVGETLRAIREDEVSAASLGVNGALWKAFAFGLGAAIAGLAGVFYPSLVGTLVPDAFNIVESFTMMAMVIVGGMGTMIGPVVGAVVLTFLPELLRGFGELRLMIYGIALTLVVLFMPGGMVQAWMTLRAHIR